MHDPGDSVLHGQCKTKCTQRTAKLSWWLPEATSAGLLQPHLASVEAGVHVEQFKFSYLPVETIFLPILFVT